MAKPNLQQNFQAYAQWKLRLARTVKEYEAWLAQQGLSTPEAVARIKSTLQELRSDKLTVAFVAEVSRGKTELINAIFFASQGRRLLPSSAGRTTMCPSEMLWDEDRNEAYLRLLPIETRTSDLSVQQLKETPAQWVHYPLNIQSPEQMENALSEIAQTKVVSVAQAAQLGLYQEEVASLDGEPAGMVEIPRWRHAVISFPHPLLRHGLVILDTPGLNALGSEPELTLSTLPSAQAVLFVLAADTGVTRSDLDMWRHHIKGFQNRRQRGLVVVLNKIDTLWDDLKTDQGVEETIERQKGSAAKILGIGESSVFPVSAYKGLLAKVRDDPELLRKSALADLEAYLATDMLDAHQQAVLDSVEAEVGQLIETNRNLAAQQLSNVKRQLAELEELRDKSDDVIHHLLEKTRDEQAQYLQSVSQFQASRRELLVEAEKLRHILEPQRLDLLIEQAHRDMLKSWTTLGMKKTMKSLFDNLRGTMQAATAQCDGARKLARGIYQRFQNEFGFASSQPQSFSTMKYRVELEILYQDAETYRNSPIFLVSDQNFVVKRFFQVIVARARDILTQLNQAQDTWFNQVLTPLIDQIQEYKDTVEKRLVNLQKIGRSKALLQSRIEELETHYAEQARQLTALRNLFNGIHLSRPDNTKERPRPRLVVTRGSGQAPG